MVATSAYNGTDFDGGHGVAEVHAARHIFADVSNRHSGDGYEKMLDHRFHKVPSDAHSADDQRERIKRMPGSHEPKSPLKDAKLDESEADARFKRLVGNLVNTPHKPHKAPPNEKSGHLR